MPYTFIDYNTDFGERIWAENTNELGKPFYFPYSLTPSGATENIYAIQFDLNHTGFSHSEGLMYWNDTDKTVNLDLEGGTGVKLQVGQEMMVRGVNKTGAQINNGTVIYVDGAQGNRPTFSLADCTSGVTAHSTIGFATHDIGDSNNGYVTTFGLVRDLDTSAYSAGTIIYLCTGGTFTNRTPIKGRHTIKLGYVVTSNATEGVILCNIQIGQDLDELDDVNISGKTNNDVIAYNSTTELWEPKALGELPKETSIKLASDYTATTNNSVYLLNGSGNTVDLQMMTAIGNLDRKFYVKSVNIDNATTISPFPGEQIDDYTGATTLDLYDGVTLISDDVQWWIL